MGPRISIKGGLLVRWSVCLSIRRPIRPSVGAFVARFFFEYATIRVMDFKGKGKGERGGGDGGGAVGEAEEGPGEEMTRRA